MDRSNILHEMKRLCAAAKVAAGKVFPYKLRHLFVTLYYKVSKDISRLADLLGHSSINTTRIYTCVSGADAATADRVAGIGHIKKKHRITFIMRYTGYMNAQVRSIYL